MKNFVINIILIKLYVTLYVVVTMAMTDWSLDSSIE